jgi:hypothetical protein
MMAAITLRNDAFMNVAAHLILGSREEPFLGAMLASLEGVAARVIVNDNSAGVSPHTKTLEESRFGRDGKIVVDRSPFSGFADARNICLRLHAQQGAGDWVAFIDADEVHGPQAARVAAHLHDLPPGIAYVDGYTWHFFQSFDWYTSIERRLMFFRFTPQARWEGSVHERLTGIGGTRIALPYVYAHYGHTLEPRRHAEKGRHYSSLGAPGNVLREDELEGFDVERYFAPVYHRLMRFRGMHPPAARATVERLRPQLAAFHQITEHVARGQSPALKMRNLLRRLNYEVRWRGRALNPLARQMLK